MPLNVIKGASPNAIKCHCDFAQLLGNLAEMRGCFLPPPPSLLGIENDTRHTQCNPSQHS